MARSAASCLACPAAPAGRRANHLKAVGDDGCFVCFRLYAPKQAFCDKSCALADFEMAK